RNMRSIRYSAPRTAPSSSPRSSSRPASAHWPPPRTAALGLTSEAERPRKLWVFGECRAQPLEVAQPQGDRPSPRNAAGGIGEADEPLPLVGLEQLDDRGESLLAGALRQGELFQRLRGAPRRGAGLRPSSCACRHGRQRSGARVTRGSPLCAETGTIGRRER